MAIRIAQRAKTKLKIGLSSPSGGGKTYSALLLASGLAPWDKICLIDTENSGDFYSHLGAYNIMPLEAPFTPESYIDAIQEAEDAGMEVIIIDSMSHEWDGLGGVLQLNEKVAQGKFKSNGWAAWSEMTPRHQRLLYVIIGSKCHIITTVRNKVETAMVEGAKGKEVMKVGTKEIQREGYEYELTINFNIDRKTHLVTPSKDRTGLFEGKDPFIITKKTGEEMKAWAESGVDAPKVDYLNEFQFNTLSDLITKLEYDVDAVLEYYKIPSLKRMSKEDAGDLIIKLKNVKK